MNNFSMDSFVVGSDMLADIRGLGRDATPWRPLVRDMVDKRRGAHGVRALPTSFGFAALVDRAP